ncbi:uncharacterized protein LOC112589310 [Harpegnathos saltator]|uniref:uncharacterized protein LOC112589310 n=1 Tax=Harpegnathos saltator TaxID=610380 RepID=UPI000DBEE3D3|nr:uncharacterized protein LOC112589310 [Harpegnathos saltator]
MRLCARYQRRRHEMRDQAGFEAKITVAPANIQFGDQEQDQLRVSSSYIATFVIFNTWHVSSDRIAAAGLKRKAKFEPQCSPCESKDTRKISRHSPRDGTHA